MTTYSYPASSTIQKVVFEKNDDGGSRAYLFAREGTPAEELSKIAYKLQCAGLQNVPSTHDGNAALEVRGFMWESKCCDWLVQHGFASGTPKVEKSEKDKETFVQKVRKQTLLSAALLYVIGDIKFISYGIKGASPLNIAGGAAYAFGTLTNLVFNRKSGSDLKVHDLAQRMADHMNSLDIKPAQDTAMERILDEEHKGFIQKADEKLRHYPAELMHLGIAMAGACIAAAAWKQLGHSKVAAGHIDEYLARKLARIDKLVPGSSKHISAEALKNMRPEAEKLLSWSHKSANWLDVGLGSMSLASGLFGALVTEKAHDPDVPYKDGIEGWWQWMQERPLTISGTGLMISTLCHAGSTAIEYKMGTTDGKSAIIDRGLFVATNLLAEFLIAVSSKGHGHGVQADPTIDGSAINIAAELIARQPDDKQPELINYMGKFLGREDVLAMSDTEVLKQLQHAVEAIKENPWAKAPPQQGQATVSKELPAWQAKIAAQPETPTQLGA